MSHVEIQVDGHLDESWLSWFEGFKMFHLDDEVTLLTGEIRDQSDLYGLIAKLRDLGAKLISVNYGEGDSNEFPV